MGKSLKGKEVENTGGFNNMEAYKQEFIELNSGASHNLSKRRKTMILQGFGQNVKNRKFS